jgi:hypothetical protein
LGAGNNGPVSTAAASSFLDAAPEALVTLISGGQPGCQTKPSSTGGRLARRRRRSRSCGRLRASISDRSPSFPQPATRWRLRCHARLPPPPRCGGPLWSPELHGEYRRARDQRDIALEIADLAQEPIPQTWRLPEPLPDDDEELAAMARRNLIEVAPVRFPAGGDEFAYLGFWIAALEEAGVLVITSAGVKVDEMRGFSLHFAKLPVIVVNGSDFAWPLVLSAP